jgi:heavy metal sensor kinase
MIRSIRFSLIGYFLALLGLAVAPAFALVYGMAWKAVTEGQTVAAKDIEGEYDQRCREEENQLDKQLLFQAQTLARLVQFQNDYTPRTVERLQLFASLTAGAAPNSHFLLPIWVAERGTRGPVAQAGLVPPPKLGEIRLDEHELMQVDGHVAQYIQIDSGWKSSYFSESLEGTKFQGNPAAFAPKEAVASTFSTGELADGTPVRSVLLKVPATRPLPFGGWPGWRPPPPGGAQSPGQPRRVGDPPFAPPDPEASPRSPPLYIQCGCDLDVLQKSIAKFKTERDDRLQTLEAKTAASLASLRNQLLLTVTLTFLAIILGTLWLVNRGLAPLERLGTAVGKVSARDFRLPLGDERMPRELQPIVDRLKQALELLKRAFEREKQATADISHELRTPLAAMMTTLEIALRKPRQPEEYRELLEDCKLSAQQMNQIVERLLTLARLDAGVDLLRPQAVDLAQLADQCADVVRPLAEARGLSLRVHRNGALPVSTDPDKMREVLSNLLHNAIQYNRPQGTIDVNVSRQDGCVEVAVSDTGIGMRPEVRGRIFERFYRADQSRNEDGMHVGLGLAIVKEYLDLMGGRIAVDSVEGQGSTFRVLLPAGPAKA